MKKRLLTVLAFCFLLIGSAFSVNAETQPDKIPNQEDIGEHTHSIIDESLLKSLQEKGYTKKEIYIASHIAKFSNQKVEEILAFYKKNDSSWEKTAQHYGVDLNKIKKNHHHMDKFLEKNKDIVLKNVSEFSGKTAQELQGYLDKEIPLRFLVSGSAMAKAANKDLDEIIKMKEQGKSFHEIKKELNIEKEQIHTEMRKLVDKIQEDIKKGE
ncbi:hypothetical protein J7I93_21660 [Bacillus sp. ISL-47]|uniref:hypothetical protein n=1 Tax=Bacillus sp. ISL-47 TaxID=2819130 RepID=UPI001BE666BF|nr:hypothetical protein [Bacillus sp. ISL-47]MBT2690751.1 hypothetical protein [Bacillus sp. ISL-47]MBT2709695.1 hypothetical protein [Pseudomonas sp. ISL-84]